MYFDMTGSEIGARDTKMNKIRSVLQKSESL